MKLPGAGMQRAGGQSRKSCVEARLPRWLADLELGPDDRELESMACRSRAKASDLQQSGDWPREMRRKLVPRPGD